MTEHVGPTMIAVPANHFALILPITGDADDAGAQIIDQAIALHHVTDSLDNGELSPVGYDGFGSPIYRHQFEEDG